jgi:hypothetical protein
MPSTDDVERYYRNRGGAGDNGGTGQRSTGSRAYSEEPTELKYLRQIRTATVWMAWTGSWTGRP